MKGAAILLALAASFTVVLRSGEAAIRINGNQMVEAAASVSRNVERRPPDSVAGRASSPIDRIVFSLGQGIMARGELPGAPAGDSNVAFVIGVGLGYDIAHVAYGAYTACPVAKTGDVNGTGAISAADIIYLVVYVFKNGPAPLPCAAAGDATCDGSVTAADVIYLVIHVFKGGPAPCDVCPLIPGVWTCP